MNNKLFIHYSMLSSREIIKYLPVKQDVSHIHIKPNWVIHEDSSEFPINALVTSSELLDNIITACIKYYPACKLITIGDVPLQTCNWEKLVRQAGVNTLIKKYSVYNLPEIKFLDLRKERYRLNKGYFEFDGEHNGDPFGYREIVLNERSLLEEVSEKANLFRVSDYDPERTVSVHKKGSHKYLISGTILNADLIINVPKMKTHQKAGITGALKNLVGINGSKAYLVHHRIGMPKNGGDEFSDNCPLVFRVQVRLREFLQKRFKLLFIPLKVIWEIVKRIKKIETVGTSDNLGSKNFYIGAGSWYGNDSIWRMTYDLNNIILYADRDGGKLLKHQQRDYIVILDGIISGEGNGPLQPIPVDSNIIAIARNPFLIDFLIAKLMGFDYRKIPTLSNYQLFQHKMWTNFCPDNIHVSINGDAPVKLKEVDKIKNYVPPPGWKGHIEMDEE